MNTTFHMTLIALPEQAARRIESLLHKRFTVCSLENLVGAFLMNRRLQKDCDPSRDSEYNKKTGTHSVITLQSQTQELKKMLVTARYMIKYWRTSGKETNSSVANAK